MFRRGYFVTDHLLPPRMRGPGGGYDDRYVALPRPEIPHERTIIVISDDESEPEVIADRRESWHHNGDNDLRPTTSHDDLSIRGDKPSPIQSPHAYKRAKIEDNATLYLHHEHLDLNANRGNHNELKVSHRAHDHLAEPYPIQPGVAPAEPTYQQAAALESGQASLSSIVTPNSRLLQVEAERRPPYFVDGCFEVKMYNGPGYEKFPVVLGTVKGHQEICNKWDAEEKKKLERQAERLRQELNSVGKDPNWKYESAFLDQVDHHEDPSKELLERCLESVREVFPDIEVAFITKKIEATGEAALTNVDGAVVRPEPTQVAQTVIDEVLEMDTYPREDTTTSSGRDRAPPDGTGVTISWDRDLEKDAMYLKDAVILLAKTFDHVPTHHIHKIVEEKKSIFNAYVHLYEQEEQFYSSSARPYHRLRNPRREVEKKYLLTPNDRRIPYQYYHRVNELQAAKQHVAREAIQDAARKAKEVAELANLLSHIETGALAECQCCFDAETPLNRIVPCMADQQHYFCYACVESLANNQVGMMRHEMKCMDGGGCTADLSNEHVGKAVPIVTFDRLEMNRQQAEVMAAGIDGLEKCRWCDYQAICDTVEHDPVFVCLNPDCKRATCRRCNQDNHLPKSCKENKQDGLLSGRHNIEEARSEAIMRTCPNKKCGVKIIKDFGCNKMQCVKCQSKMCYVCKEDISHLGNNAYWHFNKPGAKCPLYDEAGADNRHEEEAMIAELKAIETLKKTNVDVDESQLRIESGKSRALKLDEHPAADLFYQGMLERAGRIGHEQHRIQVLQQRIALMQEMMPDPEEEAFIQALLQEPEAGQFNRDGVRDLHANLEVRLDRQIGANIFADAIEMAAVRADQNLGAAPNAAAPPMGWPVNPPAAPAALGRDRNGHFRGAANLPNLPRLPMLGAAPGLPVQYPLAQGQLGGERQLQPAQCHADRRARLNHPRQPNVGQPENPPHMIPGRRRP
ncbi:hypothetical protein PV08_08896 [Exophiala spinifera]|uniref:RING-type domain-containing protein n=1 Tax=Exophiala spinifera TaxID=91928 RepID=A0A0D2B4S0_9EURO|nr:uncharacterized protein PV08_08896 [Exophiala spinifera]KIW13705.1 hypothetical protein PV08_08896 [Exophiala spinifera]